MKTLILIPQFVDRAGRTVFHIKEIEMDGAALQIQADILGEIRLPENDGQVELEWAQEQEDE